MIRKTLPAALLLAAMSVPLGAQEREPEAQSAPATVEAGTVETATEANEQAVPVASVVLFSSGVGYFEHYGNIQGQGSTELRFKTEQINDLLKSLVLQDLDGGTIRAITYPSLDPLDKTLKSFQIDISGNPTLADLLNQLRGAEVIVQQSGTNLEGTILGVEKKKRPADDGGGEDAPLVEIAVLNLITEKGIVAIELDSVSAVQLEDEKLQAELNEALVALAAARDQDKKPVKINFSGEGDRRVRLGYVVETPVWKTSYRLILPGSGADEETKPMIQGWAIVENQTDNDWENVQLSLVSGRPISFVMDLYTPLYIPRPVVEPELYASLRPQTYAGAMLQIAEGEQMKLEGKLAARSGRADVPAQTRGINQELAAADAVAGVPAAAPAESFDVSSSVRSVASAAQVGELFQYTVGNVSLPRQKSAMLPIITDDIEIEKLSIYNAGVLPKHPLNGARVKNTTGKHLLQGPITVLDGGTYAGDAQIDNLPPGQERLLSYGVDLQVLVDSTSQKNESALLTGKIQKGTLILTRKHVATQTYASENKTDKEKTLVIEHPKRSGWKLISPEKALETTDTLYRFKGTLEPNKTVNLEVKEEIVQGETLAILPADLGQLVFYSNSGEIPQEVRDALVKAIGMRQAISDVERNIAEKEKQLAEITAEQQRIRENLKTVQQGTAYHDRLLKKLNDQETTIETLQSEIDTLDEQLKANRAELEAYLANLTVG